MSRRVARLHRAGLKQLVTNGDSPPRTTGHHCGNSSMVFGGAPPCPFLQSIRADVAVTGLCRRVVAGDRLR